MRHMLDDYIAIRPLNEHPYANAFVAISNYGDMLVSYGTPVAEISNNRAYCYGLYSITTRNHISAYALEHDLSYGVFKKVHEGGYKYYDILSGKFVK